MSEQNSKARAETRLTHKTFYKVCEVLKKHRQEFLDARPNNRKAAKLLSELAGIPVSENSMTEIKEVSGVNWESKPEPRMSSKAHRTHADRTLARCLIILFKKLGEEVPSVLSELYEELTGRQDVRPDAHQQNGQAGPPAA